MLLSAAPQTQLQAYVLSDIQALAKKLMSNEDFATAVQTQKLQAAATAAARVFQAMNASHHHSYFREDISHQSILQTGTAGSMESSRQHTKASRSTEAQMLDSILSSHPLPGSSATDSQPLRGHPRPTHYSGGPMHSYSSNVQLSQQSSHDMLEGHHHVQLRGIPRTGPQLLVPGPNGTVLAHAPAGLAPTTFLEVPDSLDDIVQGLEGGELSLLPEAPATGGMGLSMTGPSLTSGAAMLSGRASAEEQMAAAAAELASSSVPLARLALPTVSEGPLNVLQDLRRELVQLEEAVPWTAVRKHWRTKRSSWRRSVREAYSAVAMAACLRDLQAALLAHPLPGHPPAGREALNLGPVWQQSLASCLDGGEKHAMLLALWNDFKKQVSLWLGAISMQPQMISTQLSRTKAARALRALMRAEAQGAEAVMQVPLDAILIGDGEALETMKAILSQEQLALVARCEQVSQGAHITHADDGNSDHASMLEIFAGDSADDFDSGAESVDECSQATDMCDSD
ncbi:hypothetical protein WJX84_004043 [Apatococcus fuscideae]|uniref:Uncharacterized protein n=1 Tax=Apatococcus fuscideae TaxID=2026836 RepID=A0AAW1TJY8_9CHLO